MTGAPPTEPPGSAATSIDSLPDEVLAEVMLRVPTPAALVRAAAASRRWRGVVATDSDKFLCDYRERHRCSPFLGVYVPRQLGGLPSFQMADSIRSIGDDVDRDLQRAAARAFSLGGLDSHPDWSLLDCHNGRLLLARGHEYLVVYSPLSGERISVRLPRDDVHPDYFSASACLMRGHGDAASFRVFFVQHRRRGQMVRALEYDSRWESWQYHPWETLGNIEGTVVQGKVTLMHAGDLIFCKSMGPSLLLLDTSKMEFCVIPLPGDKNPKHYSIGDMEDGVCCLASVEVVGILNQCRLRVWKLEELNWKLDKETEVKQVLGNNAMYPYYSIRAVAGGIALLCKHDQHFIVDLETFYVKEMFEFKDVAAYPMHMPWPPTFSVPIVTGEQSAFPIGAYNADVAANSSVYAAAMTPRCSDKLRDVAAPSASEELDGQDPIATVPTPSIAEDLDDQDSERRTSLVGLEHVTWCPFEATNELHPKYTEYLESPPIQERKHNWGHIQVCIKTQRCLEDWGDIEGESSSRSTGVHDPLTLQTDLDGQYAESKLNKDPEIRCNDDLVIFGCSHGNRPEPRDESAIHDCVPSNALEGLGIQESIATALTTAQTEECFDKESDIRNVHDAEALIPHLNQILCYQDPDLVHREAKAQSGEGLPSNAAQAHQRGLGGKRRSNRAPKPNPRVQGSDWMQ
ncbi:hypothetical protein BS78_02G371000 [Paspalum vaginatum]|nr:hypothetical protein BS78_02G371000 [Paspalum vaginatum]